MHFQPHYEESICFQIIYSFHMPLFMVLSGYFASSSMKLGGAEFLTKKFRQLLLPCLSWGVICWLIITSGLIEGRFALKIKELFVGWIGLMDNFWFLKSCFICYVLAWICKRAGKYQYVAFSGAWLLCSMQGHFNLSMMFPSFVFGMMLRENVTLGYNLYRYRLLIGIIFLCLLVYGIGYDAHQYIVRLVLGLSGAYTCYILFSPYEVFLTPHPELCREEFWFQKENRKLSSVPQCLL